MKLSIKWLLIPVGILLVVMFASNLGKHKDCAPPTDSTRFFYNPYVSDYSQQLLNDPNYRDAYQRSEASWYGPYVCPHSKSKVWSSVAFSLLLIFGVMEFGVGAIIQLVHVLLEWRDGNEVNWPSELFFALAIPAACILAMVEIIFLAPK